MIRDTVTLIYMLGILGISVFINTILGIVIAKKKLEFDKKKLKFGLLKSIVVCISIVAFCFTLELLPYILSRAKIQMPEEVVHTIELLMLVLTAYVRYAKDIFEKIKLLLNEKEVD